MRIQTESEVGWLAQRRTSIRFMSVVWKTIVFVILAAGATTMIFPLYWMINLSLQTEGQIFRFPPYWYPSKFVWQNYVQVFELFQFERYFFTSVWLAVVTTIGALLSATLGAYSFARLRCPGKDLIFAALLATMFLPGQVTLIPVFLWMKTLGWVGTYWPMVVPPFLGGAFGIFLLRQHFLTLPVELIEAAKLDGASPLRIFSTIALPLAKPALATLALLGFMGSWNSLMGPLIYLRNRDMWTLPMLLAFLQSAGEAAMGGRTLMGTFLAASTLSVMPVLIVFLFAQEFFVQSIATSGLKF